MSCCPRTLKVAVNADSHVNLLTQARLARDAGNWSLLIQCLQQLLSVIDSERFSTGDAAPTQLLDLALDVLATGDFQQRWDIAKLIPRLGTRAIAPLIELLEDEDADEELRWFAGRILGEFQHPDAIAALVELMQTSESEELQMTAAAALGQIGSPAIAALTELLGQTNTRLLAVQALAQIRRSETIVPLLSVVQDPQVAIRTTAIEALSSFHDSRIPPVLLHALDDLAAPVRREAVIGLGFRPDLEAELDLVNRLIPRLYDFNLDVCTSAAFSLGRLQTDAAASALFQVLQSPNTPVSLQSEIIRALGWIETKTSCEYLEQALDRLSAVAVQQEIVTAIGRVEPPELRAWAAKILVGMLQGNHPATQHEEVKQAIALALGQLGEQQALDCLIGLLADTDMGVRLHAIAAMKQLAPTTAYQQLQQLATNTRLTPDLQQGVAIALQEWK